MNTHLVYPGLSVTVGIRRGGGEDDLMLSGDGGEEKGRCFPLLLCGECQCYPRMYLMCRLCWYD